MDLINIVFSIFNVYIFILFLIIVTMMTIENEKISTKEGKSKGKQVAINTSLILAGIISVAIAIYIIWNYIEDNLFLVVFGSLTLISANQCTPIQSLSSVFNKSTNKLSNGEIFALITSLSAIDLLLTRVKIDTVVKLLLNINNKFISEFLIISFLFILFYMIIFYTFFSLNIIIGRISKRLGLENKSTTIQNIIYKTKKDIEIKSNNDDFILIRILKFICNVFLNIVDLLKTFISTFLEAIYLFILKPTLSIIEKLIVSSERENIKFLIKSSIVISLTILKIFMIYSTDLIFSNNILDLYDFLATVIIIPIVFEWISSKQ